MIATVVYGLTIGGILYIISIGLSLTFGTMRIVNFAQQGVYSKCVEKVEVKHIFIIHNWIECEPRKTRNF